jgi:hypothetical protein
MGRANFQEIRNGGECLEHRIDCRIHVLARRGGGGGK